MWLPLQHRPALLLATLCLAGCGSDPHNNGPVNHAPIVVLKTPVLVPVDADVVLDATGTEDPDGDPVTLTFRIVGGESTRTSELTLTTQFANARVYTIRVMAEDPAGAFTEVTHQLTARPAFPDPPDFCAETEPCETVSQTCEGGLCYERTAASVP